VQHIKTVQYSLLTAVVNEMSCTLMSYDVTSNLELIQLFSHFNSTVTHFDSSLER
jgi:hypothetical protein